MITIDGIIFSLQKYGGISVYFEEIIKRLFKSNLQYKTLIFDNISIADFSRFGEISLRNARLFERYRKCLIDEKSKVFHSSYYRTSKLDIPLITTVHDFTYEKYIKGFKKNVHVFQKYRAIRSSSSIICISHNTKNDLLNYLPDIDEKKIKVIYNGVSDYFFSSDQLKVRANKPFILYVGARSGYKNFETLVKAFKNLFDFDFVCVGGGKLNHNEKDLVSRYIGSRFYHHEIISNTELNQLYNQAFCLIYPSLYEGFGIPPLEALKCGCPVICSNTSSIPEVVGKAGILLSDFNEDTLKCSLDKLKDSNFRNSLIEKGLFQANLFSWDKTFEETCSIYNLYL